MDIETLSTIELINILCKTTEQGIKNIIAYELVNRLCPLENNIEISKEMLEEFGYKKLRKNSKILKLK